MACINLHQQVRFAFQKFSIFTALSLTLLSPDLGTGGDSSLLVSERPHAFASDVVVIPTTNTFVIDQTKKSESEPEDPPEKPLAKTTVVERPRLVEVSHSVVAPDTEEVRLRLDGAGKPTVTASKNRYHQVVILDFPDLTLDNKIGPVTPKGSIVERVRIRRTTTGAIVAIDLPKSQNISYTHNVLGDSLVVRLYREAKEEPQPAQSAPKPEEPKAITQPEGAQAPDPEPAAPVPANTPLKIPTPARIDPPAKLAKSSPPLSVKEETSSPQLQQILHTVDSPTSEEVRLRMSGTCAPKDGLAESPRYRVFYFDCETMVYGQEVKDITATRGGIVKRVRLGKHGGSVPKTRVSIDVPKSQNINYTHRFDQSASTLVILITRETDPAQSTVTEQPITVQEVKPPQAPTAPAMTPPSRPVQAPSPTPQWTLRPGDTIGHGLQTWAEKAGWKVVWNMSKDWAVPASSTFHGDFQAAASEVISTLAANGALVRAQFFSGNKTLLVTGPGESSQ